MCPKLNMHVLLMYVYIDALIGALGDMDVSQVEYTCTCIMKVCIYQRAESTGSTI